MSLQEAERLEEQAETLKPHVDISSGKQINFSCLPTMVDGKVKFVWSQTTRSLQNCYICGAKPKELALRHGRRGKGFAPDKRALNFGFSNLHVKLRSFDYICKTSINQDFKSHQCRAENAPLALKRKDQLIIDIKRVFKYDTYGGFGAAKNGAVARAAFKQPELFSEITGLPVFLIKGISTAIQAIDCPRHSI